MIDSEHLKVPRFPCCLEGFCEDLSLFERREVLGNVLYSKLSNTCKLTEKGGPIDAVLLIERNWVIWEKLLDRGHKITSEMFVRWCWVTLYRVFVSN